MFDFLFNPQGRISRRGIWLGFLLPYLAVTILISVLAALVPVLGLLSFLVSLFYFWPSIGAVPIKRLHDLGLSGWWLLLIYAVSVGLLVLTMIGAFGSDAGQAYLAAAEDGSLASMSEEAQARLFLGLVTGAMSTALGLIGVVLSVVFSLFTFVLFYLWPGQRRDNRFGRDPLAEGRGFGDSPQPAADTFA